MANSVNLSVVVPEAYKKFRCDSEFCNAPCCEDRSVYLTHYEYEQYADIGGEVGEKILSAFKVSDVPTEEKYAEIRLTIPEMHGEHPRCPLLLDDKHCYIHTKLGEEYLSKFCRTYPRMIPRQVHDKIFVGGHYLSCPIVVRQVCLAKEQGQAESLPVSFKPVSVDVDDSPYAAFGRSYPTCTPPVFAYATEMSEYVQTVINQCTLIIQSRDIISNDNTDNADKSVKPMCVRVYWLYLLVQKLHDLHTEYIETKQKDPAAEYPNIAAAAIEHARAIANNNIQLKLNLSENSQTAFENVKIYVIQSLSAILKSGNLAEDYIELIADSDPDAYTDGITLRNLYDFLGTIDDGDNPIDGEYAQATENFLAAYIHNTGFPFFHSLTTYTEKNEQEYRYVFHVGIFAVSLQYALLRDVAKLQKWAADGEYSDDLFVEAAAAVSRRVVHDFSTTTKYFSDFAKTCNINDIPLMGLDRLSDFAAE